MSRGAKSVDEGCDPSNHQMRFSAILYRYSESCFEISDMLKWFNFQKGECGIIPFESFKRYSFRIPFFFTVIVYN